MLRFAKRIGMLCLIALLVWVSCAAWNSVKPLPPGTHVTSLPARLSESQLEFIDQSRPDATLERELETVARAERTIVLDQSPLRRALAAQLLLRKRQRPNLKILLITDPRNEIYGGTPARTLDTLEAAGIVVARTRLERMRDPDPFYSSLWRLSMAWWSDPFDEIPGQETLASALRRRNLKADERCLLVADDGAGGWTSIVMSAVSTADPPTTGSGIEIRGHLARDIVESELRIAAWSTDDDRFPDPPPAEGRGVGSIDARFLSEGAIRTALRDAVSAAGSGDTISVSVHACGDRQLIAALLRAAARGARVRLVLDAGLPGTQAAAGELMRSGAGNVDVHWRKEAAGIDARYALIRHRDDVWIEFGSANLTRSGLDDLDLEAELELHMPERAAAARAVSELFAAEWSAGSAYADHADESAGTYWRYRLAEATGSAMV
jgi:hypothetical protein